MQQNKRLRTMCNLAQQRCRLVVEKKRGASQHLRRQVATQLQSGRTDAARIRIEGSVREEDRAIAAENVELLVELLSLRVDSLDAARKNRKDPPDDCSEAVHSICFAASRFDEVPELASIRDLLASMFGKERVRDWEAGNGKCTNSQLVQRLAVTPPSNERKAQALVDAGASAGIQLQYNDTLFELQQGGSSAQNGGSERPSASAPMPPPDIDDDERTNDIANGTPRLDEKGRSPYPDAQSAASAAASFADMAVNAAHHACAAVGEQYNPSTMSENLQADASRNTESSNSMHSANSDEALAKRLQALKGSSSKK